MRDLGSMSVDEGAHLGEHADSAPPVRRVALSRAEAAAALGVSVDFLDQHVVHELRIVCRGRRRLIPLRELERWLDANAARRL